MLSFIVFSLFAEAQNFCRNPITQLGDVPWCYTTDPETRWDSCDIPMCEKGNWRHLLFVIFWCKWTASAQKANVSFLVLETMTKLSVLECRTTVKGTEYRGRMNRTQSGTDCQAWAAQSPHNHTLFYYPEQDEHVEGEQSSTQVIEGKWSGCTLSAILVQHNVAEKLNSTTNKTFKRSNALNALNVPFIDTEFSFILLHNVIYIYHDHPLRLPWPSIATATATANHIIP